MNYRWPATDTNCLRPWYGIAWGLLLLPVYLFFRAGLAVVYGLSHVSLQEFYRMWEETG